VLLGNLQVGNVLIENQLALSCCCRQRINRPSLRDMSESAPKVIPPPPPPVLDSARILFYATVNDSVKFTGRTLLFVDGQEVGRVPCLAICEQTTNKEALLFHCDCDWNTLGCSAHASTDEAKARAEQIYAGISTCWIAVEVSKEAAEAYQSEIRKPHEEEVEELRSSARCSFCGRKFDEVNDMHINEQENAFICALCVEEFYRHRS
jgi:ClpX C4-type zinc finger